jgi:hypothetical protein
MIRGQLRREVLDRPTMTRKKWLVGAPRPDALGGSFLGSNLRLVIPDKFSLPGKSLVPQRLKVSLLSRKGIANASVSLRP